jgi:DNA repair protein RAD51
MGFTTAAIVAEQRGAIAQITTGCKELDSILEGKMGWTGSWTGPCS